jgi:hypothetical protein
MEKGLRKFIVTIVLTGAAVALGYFASGELGLLTPLGDFKLPAPAVVGGCFGAGAVMGLVLRS